MLLQQYFLQVSPTTPNSYRIDFGYLVSCGWVWYDTENLVCDGDNGRKRTDTVYNASRFLFTLL
jgi:hypothetical protein